MTFSIRDRQDTLEASLIAAYGSLSTGTIGHRIDGGALDSKIKMLSGSGLVVGPAVTVRTCGRDSTVCHKVFDIARPGDVLVIQADPEGRFACWGEMLTIAAQMRGIVGVVIDGPMTDIVSVRERGFPVFAHGVSPLTTQLLGHGGEINTVVRCGGIEVSPGELVLADEDGVLVISAEMARAQLREYVEEATGDDEYREQLLAGRLPSELAPIDALIESSVDHV